MPSSYTLNNGIELIATGEQSGSWGTTTNTNLSLIDTSLDGQITITLASAGSSGSPNSLPINDGVDSNGRNRLIIFNDGGDLGAAAYVQLTPNDAEKIIYIRNALSGSRSVLVFQGTYNASNDYEIPAGKTAVIQFDGAGTGAVAANVFNNAHFDALNVVGAVSAGSLTLTTDLAVADGGTGASDAATARTNLGLVIGADVQAYSSALDDFAGLTATDGNFIVGDGANFVAESGATARTSLGLGTIATQSAASVSITGGSISGITDLAIADGGTGASDASTARTNLGLAIGTNVQAYDAGLTDIAGLAVTDSNFIVANGTNWVAESGATLRTSAGLGTASDVQFDSFGVGTAASGTTGEIRATNDVTAFYSSDKRLKENITNIDNAVDIVKQLNGVRYDWTEAYIESKGGEDGIFVRKQDIGVIAQEVEKVFPEIVAENSEGYKAVKYERLVAVLIEAVKELSEEVARLKGDK
jgi:hypothetical protein